jgi:uncharacterized membrane protein YbhN (UPF0104 family)
MSMLMLLATAASFLVNWSDAPTAIRILVQTIRWVTLGLIVGVTLILVVPALSGEKIRGWVGAVPLVGPTAARLIATIGTYRDQKARVAAACAISLVSNSLFILSFYFIAQGLPVQSPSLAKHFVIIPSANLAGAIPATPSGLGTMELAVDRLYQAVPTSPPIPAGDGTLVSLGQRATMIFMAALCLAFYVLGRGSLREVMHEIEEAEAAGEAL